MSFASAASAGGNAHKRKRKTRLLVIQLGRLGDTLQSLMALRAAKQLYPDLEITFVVRERFADAALRVRWLDKVVSLPTSEFLSAGSSEESLARLAQWVSPLIGTGDGQPWDIIVNWTYSESSSWLTALLPARAKLGYTRRSDTTLFTSDGWSHYLQAIVQGQIDQNIHLTDILSTQLLTALQIHLGDPADAGDSAVTGKSFFELGYDGSSPKRNEWLKRDSSRRWIGIHLGSARDLQSWDAERWAAVASHVLRRHPDIGIALLGGGGRNEDALAQRFMKALEIAPGAAKSVLCLVGNTDFDSWASIVSECQWILSGDSAAIHLASVLGTRVLDVSTGPPRFAEAGPYGNGHYVISTAEPCSACAENTDNRAAHTCLSNLSPEAVYAAWSYASGEWVHRRKISLEGHFTNLGWKDEIPKISVYRSRIRATDDGGGVVYEPLIQRPIGTREWTSLVVGYLARAWYCGWTPEVGHELKRPMLSPGLLKSVRELEDSVGVLEKILREASRTARELADKSSRLKSEKLMPIAERQGLAAISARLAELDALIERMGPGHPLMKAFAQMSKVLMHNLEGEHLTELGRESAESYRRLEQGTDILKDWIRFTLGLAKPMALVPASAPRSPERSPS